MRIAAFFHKGQPHVGLVSQDSSAVTPFDLPLADRELGALTLVDTLSRGEALPPQVAAIALKDVQLRAPLPHPRRNIFCVGKNYHAHAKEFARSGFDSSAKAGGEIPAEPIIFTKVPECVIATGEAIEMPKVSTAIDYEAELTVIIGKGARNCTSFKAMAAPCAGKASPRESVSISVRAPNSRSARGKSNGVTADESCDTKPTWGWPL